jgi:uncharacterized protein (DUF1778 family)
MVEPRSSRINMRLSPSELLILRLAAEKQGQPLTKFILVAALGQARQLLPGGIGEQSRSIRG